MAAANGVDHPNKLGRPVCGDHKHPRANDGTLGRDHRCDVGCLDKYDHPHNHSSRGSGDRNDHYMGSQAVGAPETVGELVLGHRASAVNMGILL